MPPKLETEKYTVLNARRIAGKPRKVDDVVELARGTADHLVASGDVELASLTPARKAREAEEAKAKAEAAKAEAAKAEPSATEPPATEPAKD